MKRQAPLYGSSAKNPNRPPVRIEDHWLMAGIGRKSSGGPGQTRPQRAASMGTHSVMEEREISRPAISVPMMISHTDAPMASPRRVGKSNEPAAPSTTFQGKPTLKTGLAGSKIDTTASVLSPAMANARPTVDPSSDATANVPNGSRLSKTLNNLGASAFGVGTGTARRRASGPLSDEKLNSPDTPTGPGKGAGAGAGTGTAEEVSSPATTTRKPEVAIPSYPMPSHTSEARHVSGSGGEAEQVPPPAAAAAAGVHKHRWGDGLKSAMRLGKSRT